MTGLLERQAPAPAGAAGGAAGPRWLPPVPLFYATVFVLVVFACFLQWPITTLDTDLWYHLNSGRYFFTHGHPPRDSYFSFIAPPRPWVDYFWLFQVVVYSLYQVGQYHALVILRAVMFLGTASLILWFLFRRDGSRAPWGWLGFVAVSCCLVLLSRQFNVRPHLFSYCFIILFLCVLEHRPRLAWWLPALGVLWCNLHGITYPILLVITGIYLLDRLRGRHEAPVGALLATLLTPLATPHGLKLLALPFVSTKDASEYINELQFLRFDEMLSGSFYLLTPSGQFVFNVLLLGTIAAAVTAAAKRTLALRHLLLCLAGAALLCKGARFVNEFSLFALPLLRRQAPVLGEGWTKPFARPVYYLGLLLLLVMPMRTVFSAFTERPRFPLSERGLARSSPVFLNYVKAGERLLNFPDQGGYYQWELYPRTRIFMDMEVPFLFTDDDIRLALDMFQDEQVLRGVLARYDPDFISVPMRFEEAPKFLEAIGGFTPVTFDEEEVLYASARHHPDLVERFGLRVLKPFEVRKKAPDKFLEEVPDRVALMADIRRLLEAAPNHEMANYVAALVYLDEKVYDRALALADVIIARLPEVPSGYHVRGDALRGLQAYPEAIRAYEQAIERSRAMRRAQLYAKIGLVHLDQRHYVPAYNMLQMSLSTYGGTATEDLFNLARAARGAGHRGEAQEIVDYLRSHRLAADDVEWREKIQQEFPDE